MATKLKNRRDPPRKANDALIKLGIDIPEFNDFGDNDDFGADDEDLEDELQALLSGRPTVKKEKPIKQTANLDKMVADCMRNPSFDDEEGNVSDDEDLLAELHSLTGEKSPELPVDINQQFQDPSVAVNGSSILNLLNDRLHLYEQAEALSKSNGETSKARRYGRALKTLKDLIASTKAGVSINEDDIPPVVQIPKLKVSLPENTQELQVLQPSTVSHPTVPKRPAPHVPENLIHIENIHGIESNENNSLLQKSSGFTEPFIQTSQNKHQPEVSEGTNLTAELLSRRNQYKIAALNAKKCGDTETALQYVKIAKKFDVVINAVNNGEAVDLSDMPPPPSQHSGSNFAPSNKPAVSRQTETENATDTSIEVAAMAAANEPTDPTFFNAPAPPATILEALEQRLEKYCSTRDAAKSEGNISKSRRLQRIVQQYESAIKSYKAGKCIAFDDLPTPPGFAPIPIHNQNTVSVPIAPETPHKPELSHGQSSTPAQPLPQSSKAVQPTAVKTKAPDPPQRGKHPKVQRAGTLTIMDKQLNYLLERQKLFRQAALESKKNGDIQQAKHYLSMSKGFDSMIEATKCGLPIDATTIPTPPQLESDYVIVNESDCLENDSGDNVAVYPKLIEDLQQQIQMCTKNKEHFMRLGDVSSASKFEKLCLDTKKDLVYMQHSCRDGEPVPKFHYETRLFSLVQCNTDLADDEVEVSVERGINLPGKPNDLDAYVKIEFPIPQESPQRAKTHTIKDTNNPEYHESFKFTISRKSRSQLRQFKRQSVKLEVWSKGGFFRSDFIIGTVMVKLVDLETKCSVHDSFDLLEGRKPCGGKLEVKLRIRDPLLSKQVEEVKEKWLIIGS